MLYYLLIISLKRSRSVVNDSVGQQNDLNCKVKYFLTNFSFFYQKSLTNYNLLSLSTFRIPSNKNFDIFLIFSRTDTFSHSFLTT